MAKERDRDKRPYITVTNELFRHPKWRRLSKDARLYLLELWGYCNEFKTDGIIEKFILDEQGPKVARELLDANWVEITASPDTFYMHDYLDHQPSAADIEERRLEKQEAGRRGGLLSAHKRNHVKRNIIDPDCLHCPGQEPPLDE